MVAKFSHLVSVCRSVDSSHNLQDLILSWEKMFFGKSLGTCAASAANYVDGAGGSCGSKTIPKLPLMLLVRKAKPDMEFPAMSSTHGSQTAKNLRDPGKQMSSCQCRRHHCVSPEQERYYIG